MESSMRLVAFAALLAVAGSALAQDPVRNARPPSRAELDLASRCAVAARTVVGAAKAFPSSEDERDAFIVKAHNALRASEKMAALVPSELEMFTAKVSMETLMQNGSPPTTSQRNDFMVAHAAAVCALTSRQPL
jgi:hypothetical protein